MALRATVRGLYVPLPRDTGSGVRVPPVSAFAADSIHTIHTRFEPHARYRPFSRGGVLA